MILKLNTYNYFFASSPFKYYAVEQNGNPDIEAIYYLGEELDLTNPESYELAINFLNDCKECDCEICDTCKSPMAGTLLGTTFISNLEKIHDTVNETTDKVIELLTAEKYELLKENEPVKCCEECCTCVDDKYCAACQEAEKASKAVEAVSNTRTFHWAQKYMDTIIDPNSELTGAEYNTLLAMFTQYGEWILKQ
jgi:hypothetical protein